MIPMIAFGAGVAVGVAGMTAWTVSMSGSSAMGYALGRKYGRLICVQLDSLEDRARNLITVKKEE
tara:strand:+ start:162 stop:356 length:195 start_codon:yes stop_codon:yes gene_type:complete